MPTITAEKVSKYYVTQKKFLRRSTGQREIGVEDVNLSIAQGEFVYVIGSSGAGKSTLLQLLAGQLKPDSGTVLLNDRSLSGFRRRSGRLSRLIGFVPQETSLNRRIPIWENLEHAAKASRELLGSAERTAERIQKVLGLTGMNGAEWKYPGELTAGECRRVELAKALINSPPILVLDEVTARLDPDSMWDVFLLLTELNRKGTTVIMATHNSEYVNMLRRRVITLVHGRVYSDEDKGRFGEVKNYKNKPKPEAR